MLGGYAFFQALAAGCRLGLFALLSRRPGLDVDQIAERLRISEYSAKVLLLAASAVDLIRRSARGGYANAPIAERLLVPTRPGNLLPFVELYSHWYGPMGQLLESMRAGTNRGLLAIPGRGKTVFERQAHDPAFERAFHVAMGQSTRSRAASLLNLERLRTTRHLLDLAGGDGSTAIGLCRAFPRLRVTIMELPTVCALARKRIRAAGLSDRIDLLPGDIFKDPYPRVDGILASTIFEMFSKKRSQALMKKCRRALSEGGTLFISADASDDDETGPISTAHLSLYFLCIASGEGRTYTVDEYTRWLAEVGFSAVEIVESEWPGHALLAAIK